MMHPFVCWLTATVNNLHRDKMLCLKHGKGLASGAFGAGAGGLRNKLAKPPDRMCYREHVNWIRMRTRLCMAPRSGLAPTLIAIDFESHKACMELCGSFHVRRCKCIRLTITWAKGSHVDRRRLRLMLTGWRLRMRAKGSRCGMTSLLAFFVVDKCRNLHRGRTRRASQRSELWIGAGGAAVTMEASKVHLRRQGRRERQDFSVQGEPTIAEVCSAGTGNAPEASLRPARRVFGARRRRTEGPQGRHGQWTSGIEESAPLHIQRQPVSGCLLLGSPFTVAALDFQRRIPHGWRWRREMGSTKSSIPIQRTAHENKIAAHDFSLHKACWNFFGPLPHAVL